MVVPYGRHELSCKHQLGRWSRHNELNHLIKRSLVQAKVQATLEPANLSRLDGKRPDGLTYPRTPQDMDGALHTDFTKSETSGGIKTIISPFVYL